MTTICVRESTLGFCVGVSRDEPEELALVRIKHLRVIGG